MTKTVTTKWETLVKGWKFLDADKALVTRLYKPVSGLSTATANCCH